MIEEVKAQARSIELYRPLVGDGVIDEILTSAGGLRNMKLAHFNSTAKGGGVAEILRSLTPLMRDVGIDARWYVAGPDNKPRFFQVTKRIHNMLQGMDGGLSAEEKHIYLGTAEEMAARLNGQRHMDVWFLHDPQLLPMLYSANGASPRTVFWVCHIDMSHPNKSLLQELMPFTSPYDGLVFTDTSYVPPDVNGTRVRIIPPAIDPLTPKNIPMDNDDAKRILEKLGIDVFRPLVTQVSRFDMWKDPKGVIDAYRLARKSVPGLQLALAGVIEARDDPEARVVLQEVIDHAGGDPDMHIIWDPDSLPDTIDRTVNALQSGSDVVLQKSIREGFGLTVTEAMWKGAAVIGGNVGGIRLQIQDGVSGFLVNSSEQCASRIVELMHNPRLRESMGRAARESVRRKFLLPRILRDYLKMAGDRLHS